MVRLMSCLWRRTRLHWDWILLSIIVVVCAALGTTVYLELWDVPWFSIDLGEEGALVGSDPGNTTTRLENQAPLRPLPLNCPDNRTQPLQQTKNTSSPTTWDRHYCSWNKTLEDCYKTLMPTFHRKTSWVFLGDNGMSNIPYFLSLKWPGKNLTVSTRRNPCQNLVYYGLSPPENGWQEPNPELGEGPTGIGKEHHFCMDCENCWNVAMESGPADDQDLSVEYLVVEYARDVSLPSQVTTTTQQTVSYYLGQKKTPPSVCVASAGLNDAAIEPRIPQDVYVQNVDKYLGLLQRVCDNVIWIGLHAVVEVEGSLVQTTNCELAEWNSAVMTLVNNRNYQNVYFIDIYEKSFHSDFESPTRLGKKFYASFTRLFKSLMAGPDLVTG